MCNSNHDNQNSSLHDKELICSLFNVHPSQISSIHCIGDPALGETKIDIVLNPTFPACPFCGCDKPHIKEYHLTKINHAVLTHQKMSVIYHRRRYRCPCCGKTFYSDKENPFTEEGTRHSSLTTINILEALKDPNATLVSVAKRFHVSPTTVANIFDGHVNISRKPLPKYLSIDEVYAFKSSDSKYICVLLDYKNKIPIEILPSRRKAALFEFFRSIPKEELEKVKVVSSDMWDNYRDVAHVFFPNATYIVDHFHVIQLVNKSLEAVRLYIQNHTPKNSNNYYLLKKFHWLLYKNDDQLLDPNREKKFNRKLNRYLNYHDIKCLLQDIHPTLEMAVNLKDALCRYYDSYKIIEENDDPNFKKEVPAVKTKLDGTATTRSSKQRERAEKWNKKKVVTKEEALAELEEIIQLFRTCEIIEMRNLAPTLNSWKNEIVNSLIVYTDLDRNAMSNALIENRNKIIKNVKHTSNGYRNWKRFRNRLLYSLNPNSTYLLNTDPSYLSSKRERNQTNYMRWKERQKKT